MKWFKHDSNSIHEAKMEKLIQAHGIIGYGLYYACIELIAQRLSGDNICFELEHDAETLSKKFQLPQTQVEEIMKFCIKHDLFQFNVETQRIVCMRLVQMLDISTSNNPDIKKICSNSEYKKLLESNTRLDEIRLDKNREDKRRKKKRERPAFRPPTREELHSFCIENDIIIDEQYFFDFYQSKGWMVGKSMMRDWRATVRRANNWDSNIKHRERLSRAHSDAERAIKNKKDDEEYCKKWGIQK